MPKRILFFEKTPFMGVELLSLLKRNYSLVSYYNDGNFRNLKASGYPIETFNNKDLTTSIDSDKAVVSMLSNNNFVQKAIRAKYPGCLALFFYMSQEMNSALKRVKIDIALPPYKIQEKIGNKIFLDDICNKIEVPVNTTISIKKNKQIDSMIFNKCSDELGLPFIIQGSLGVSGEDTYKITSMQEFINYLPKFGEKLKASKFLKNNIPISVHICITKNKIHYEGPYLQLIGFKELAKNPYQFSGNDTKQKMLTDEVKKVIFEFSMKLSKYAKTKGYLGILGIDFLWDKDTEKVFVQEINSRLVGLTRLLTGIQIEQKIIPDLVKHLNEFTHIKLNNEFKEKEVDLSKNDFSQVYIANNSKKELSIKRYLTPGIYKIHNNKLIRSKNSRFVSDMLSDEILINYSAYEGMRLHEDQTFSKIILKKSVLKDDKYELNPEFIKLLEILKMEIS